MTIRKQVLGYHQGSLEWLATQPWDVVVMQPNNTKWLAREHTHTHTSVISATWTKCNRKKLQHTNSEEYRKRNRRRIQNENIATCKSATWNSAIHKKISTRKKVQHEKITTQKSATWKWCSMEKVQQEKSKKGTKCNMKKKIATVKYKKSAQE